MKLRDDDEQAALTKLTMRQCPDCPAQLDNDLCPNCGYDRLFDSAAWSEEIVPLQRMDGRMEAAHWLQIEMAAKGCVSGTLKEWPMLAAALRKLGHELPPTTPAQELRNLCRAAVNSPID